MRRYLLLLAAPVLMAQSPGPQCAIPTPACGGGGNNSGSVNCSTQVSSNQLTLGGSGGCGVFPSGFSTNWTWLIQLINTTNKAVITQNTATVSGTGWCAGLGVQCWDFSNNMNTPYMYALSNYVSTGSTSGYYSWTAQIISTPPGGASGAHGLGCAPVVTTYQPTPPVNQTAYFCPQSPSSPIIIDSTGEGFHLTDASHGVQFRKTPAGAPLQMAWTDPAYHNGWLALPRDGKVEALSELFGNFTPQPKSDHPNGFQALAQYDLNHDGVIDREDAIYTRLRVWIDANHDGIAQPEELHTRAELGVERISLNYRESRRTDEYGNEFRYVAGIEDAASAKDNRSYDVFLVTMPR
jgi:hypothetical protein